MQCKHDVQVTMHDVTPVNDEQRQQHRLCTGADCNSIVHPHTPLRPGYKICGSSKAQRKYEASVRVIALIGSQG